MGNLAKRLKVNLDLWNLFIAIVSFVYTYQHISSENNDFGS